MEQFLSYIRRGSKKESNDKKEHADMVLRLNKLIGPLLQNDHRKRIEQPESEASVSENESVEDSDCECLEYESWEDAPLEDSSLEDEFMEDAHEPCENVELKYEALVWQSCFGKETMEEVMAMNKRDQTRRSEMLKDAASMLEERTFGGTQDFAKLVRLCRSFGRKVGSR